MSNLNDCNIRSLLYCIQEIDKDFIIKDEFELSNELQLKFKIDLKLKEWQRDTYPSIEFSDKDLNYIKLVSAVHGFSLFYPQYKFEILYDIDIQKLPIPCVVVGKFKSLPGSGWHSICLVEETKDSFRVRDSICPGCTIYMSKEFAFSILERENDPLKTVVIVRKLPELI